MKQPVLNVESRETGGIDAYQGETGRQYFDAKFDGRMDIGRRFQADYFVPYVSSTDAILDFGCGDGTALRILPASRKIGVEVNPACHAKIAALNFQESVPIEVHDDLHRLPDEMVDIAISNHCLEHVPSPLESLRELHRVLRSKGKLIIVVPFDDWRIRGHLDWRPGNADNHLFTWAPLNLGNLVSIAGFRVERVSLQSQAWSPRFFFVQRYFGKWAFCQASRFYSWLTNRREILCIAEKN